MAPLIVEICKVVNVEKHPNADRLDLITVKGWLCVAGKDTIKKNDLVIYIPVDSVLPSDLEYIIFNDSQIKPKNGRIKTVKIRGAISQGLVLPIGSLSAHYDFGKIIEGKDVKNILKITKFQPTEKAPFTTKLGQQTSKKQINPNFKKYTDINHLKNFPNAFGPDDEVVVTEKIHGTNFRAGYVPIHHHKGWKKWFKKIQSFFDKKNFRHPGYEFVFGSHNVQLQEKNKVNRQAIKSAQRHFKKNVYEEMVKKYNLRERIYPGMVLYGEIFGANIQKNYTYGLKDDIDFICFDVMEHGKWLDFYIADLMALSCGIKCVPILYIGKFKDIENIEMFFDGPSEISQQQKVREGFVIKTVEETSGHMGRAVFKHINPAYLLQKGNSDFH